jgi:ABC-type glycerol-3-phosphate transport system substrate-binding protein
MKIKKGLALLLSVIFVFTLIGCDNKKDVENNTNETTVNSNTDNKQSTTDKGTEQKVQKIIMWSNDQHDQSIYDQKIKEFNETIGKELGIEVEYTVYGSDYYSTLDVAVVAGEGPDIYKCNKISNYAEAGYIMPWENEQGFQPLIDRFKEYNAPGYGEFFGKTYGVPFRVTTYGLACNLEIFKNNNLEVPETWDEMRECARIITENGKGKTYGYALAMGYGSYNSFYVNLPNAASTGDEYFNHTAGKYDFASLSGFFGHLKDIIADGSMFPGFETMDGDTARAQYSAGNIGMIGVMSSDVTTFINQFPCDFEWQVVPYPVKDANNRYKEPVGVSTSYVVNSNVEKNGYADKVATFMNFLYSDEVFIATNDAQVDISVLGEAITSKSTNKDINPNWKRFSDMEVYCIKYPTPDGNLTIEGDTYQDVYNKILTGVITDVDGALAELDVKYNAALDEAVSSGKIKLEDYIDPNVAEKMKWTK